ncbi:MAG: PAS domain S-box protein [Candidatus Sericytochromatia bacterium]|nr:PAS domain S-box protein [Candidatus Sericytochromatia bacterium]
MLQLLVALCDGTRAVIILNNMGQASVLAEGLPADYNLFAAMDRLAIEPALMLPDDVSPAGLAAMPDGQWFPMVHRSAPMGYVRLVAPRVDAAFLPIVELIASQLADYATDLVRGETDATSTDDRFRALTEHGSDMIIIIDAGARAILYASPTTERTLGFAPWELMGQPISFLAHPDDVEGLFAAHRRMVDMPGTPIPLECRARDRSGSWHDIEAIGTCLLDDPAIAGVVVNMRDVTEQRRASDEIAQLYSDLEQRVVERTRELVTALDELRVESEERLRAERSRQESEEKYRLLFDNDQHAIVLFHADSLAILDVNRAWLTLYGYTDEEVRELTMDEVSVTGAGPMVTYDEWSNDGNLEDALRWHRKKDGLIFPVEISAGVVTWHNQRVVCAIMRDVSERLRAEAETRQRMDQIIRNQRVLLKLAASPRSDFATRLHDVLAEDAQSLGVERVSYWRFRENGAAITCEGLYTLTDRQLRASDLVLHAKDYPRYFHALREVHYVVANDAQNDPVTGEFAAAYMVPLGITSMLDAPVWVGGQVVGVVCHEHVGPARTWTPAEIDFSTSIAAMISIGLEAESRRRAEDALILSEQRFRALVQNSSDIITLMDEEGHILYDSPAIERVLGYRMADRLLRRIVDYVHPEDEASITALFAAPVEGLLPATSSVFRARHANGAWVYLEMIATNLLDDPAIRGIVGNTRDVSERKRAEEEMWRALDKAKELTELKSRFVSMTSHEFRTPLTTIMSNAEMLERYIHKWTEEKRNLAFQRINESVRQMVALLDDVLMIGKVEAGKLTYNPGPMDLVKFCTELVDTIRSGRQTDRMVDFEAIDIPAVLPLDESLLRHVLLNVLTNAVKYSPADSAVGFQLAFVAGAVTITISDSGIGIPETDQVHLFEPFYRATNVGTISGTGLGLTIVKRCVERHGGTIGVTSTAATGTTFHISIPVA